MTDMPSSQQILTQEQRLHWVRFDNALAWQLGCTLKAAAEQRQAAVAIEVWGFGQVIFAYAMPGTSTDNLDWVRRKRQTVLRFGHSSLYVGQYNREKSREFERLPQISPLDYAGHGGSVPIKLSGGGLIGAVTLSGLPQVEDHNLVCAAMLRVIESLA